MRLFWSLTFDLVDDVLAYFLTIVGILLSSYLPMLKTTGTIDVSLDFWRIGISAVVALIIVGKNESVSPDENGNTEKARAGRRKNFLPRMANALAQGIAWNTIMQMAA
jgi:hypothetical protein